MYIENWESFYQQAVDLYQRDPLKARFVTKYRHCDGKLTLKVTDDTTCLQYRTDQAADLRKVEKLNRVLFALMATGAPPPAEDVEMQPAEQQQRQQQKKTRKG